jgi:hypothetical protein
MYLQILSIFFVSRSFARCGGFSDSASTLNAELIFSQWMATFAAAGESVSNL